MLDTPASDEVQDSYVAIRPSNLRQQQHRLERTQSAEKLVGWVETFLPP